MTNLANLKRIADEATARQILAILRDEVDPRDVSEPTADWVRACYHEPSQAEQALHAADILLGNYGVEGWCDDTGREGVSYSNAGDVYAATLFYADGRFTVSDVATMNRRYPHSSKGQVMRDIVGFRVYGHERSGRIVFLESRPERNPLHGTMGDYGHGTSKADALIFPKLSTAEWHKARWRWCERKHVDAVLGERY